MSRPADILLRQGDTTPAWPTAGQVSFYSKSDGIFYSLDSNGIETPFSSGGGGTGTVTSVSVIANPSRITATGNPITSSGSITLDLATTAVTAGSYTNANITVDAYGRITSASDGSASGVASFNTRTGAITLTSSDVTTALGFTPGTGNGTVTSVAGTGTVSGLTLTGTVTTTGSLTLGGTLSLTSGQITTGLGFTPYNATNPNGYTTNTGTVTSVAALTLGTTGTDLSSSVATGTTTPVITLNVPTASATNRGVLSAADWTTFNSKGSGTVTSVGGTGTVSGLTLSGTVTSTGNLTLGGALTLTSGQITTGLGYTPYNGTTNPNNYQSGTVTSVAATGSADITVGGSPITTSGTLTFALANTTVTAATYGSATQVPVFTVDAKGRITGVTNTSISAGTGTVTSVAGTGTVSGLTLTGTVTTAGSLTLGGALTLTSGQITTGLGYTPYNGTTNPNNYQSGTVTSISGSGGTTGLTLAGGPITTSGTLTLGGTLAVANGGTGATTASAALTALGAYAASNPSSYTSNTGTVTSVGLTGSSDIAVTGSSPITASGTFALALSPTAVTAGSYTNANITVDANGRITSASNGTGGGGSGTVTSVGLSSSGTIVVGSSPVTTSGTMTVDLATSGVTAATYGSATQVPVFAVDAYGRVTSVTNTTITGGSSGSTETVMFKYDVGSGSGMTGSDAIYSSTSGVTATITSGAACICTFTFSGKSAPPKTITTFGQVTTSGANNFVVKDVSGYSGNTFTGGGTQAAPALLGFTPGFTSANVLTLTLTQTATGSAGSPGVRAWLMVTFGF